MQLHDARVIVTGASGGIGLQIVAALCAQGAKVVAVSRQGQALGPLLALYPDRLSWLAADLCNAAGRQQVVAEAQRLQGFNLLVNAAGSNHFSMLEQLPEQDIESMLQLNLLAPMLLARQLLPMLKQADSAMIVNVGSTYGSIGYAGYTAYCASKFGLRGFSEALRRELADSRCRVLYVAPRATRTAMNSSAAQALNAALNSQVDEPAHVAGAVLHAIIGDRNELYLGWPERLFVRLNNLLPMLVDRGLRKHLPLIRQYSSQSKHERPRP
ncbi:SDR family oxidoreductase [Pseudomonas sp. 21LCFQ010]|uniref:SDR family oxidoreductase n=1 Tax=Pseudomonas sp. 21LCFQ010 TaxID=2957506 RepID=UPI002098257C|nr:SDR family oxidoreductase [Pseudomonas sp. 21LCFQ010]MCO8162273.1 SDR family oxidoreductase [Pseudomonas sp. 21LCFQ010]